MSDVIVCVVRGVINVNKFEVRLLPFSHLKKPRIFTHVTPSRKPLDESGSAYLCHGRVMTVIERHNYAIQKL